MAFKHLGYIREYYINGKFIGSVNTEKDREECGYFGKQIEILKQDLTLGKNKKIKAGTEVMTMLIEMSGRDPDGLKAHTREDILPL